MILHNHSYILYEALHWRFLKFPNEDITHLKRIRKKNCKIVFYIKTKSNQQERTLKPAVLKEDLNN